MSEMQDLIEGCENAIQAGKFGEARASLEKLTLGNIARSYRYPIARLFRRVGAIDSSLRVLAPIVRGERKPAVAEATDHEKAEYAAALQRLGATNEALDLLKEIDLSVAPEGHLYQAYCYFNYWEYDSAIPHLESYLATVFDPYMALVGRVNLAAALAATNDFVRATELLLENLDEARRFDYRLLAANSYEILSQVRVFEGRYKDARECLERANEVLGASENLDVLFVRKWQSIVSALESSILDPIKEFREHAHSRGEAEAVRDADYFSLRISFDSSLYDHLYCGTPFPAFRRRLINTFSCVPAGTHYRLGSESGPQLNLETGEVDGVSAVSPGSQAHQLVSLLTRDFYKPVSLGEMNMGLFPGEYFNPLSSPQRIRQAVHRARISLTEARIPVEILSADGRFSLRVHDGASILIPFNRDATAGPERSMLKALRRKFARTDFSAKEAAELLGLSKAEIKRVIDHGLESNELERVGAGRSTSYSFKN